MRSFEFQSFSESQERDKKDIELARTHAFRGELCTHDSSLSRKPVRAKEQPLDVDSKWEAFVVFQCLQSTREMMIGL
jgi:hypothetical protein